MKRYHFDAVLEWVEQEGNEIKKTFEDEIQSTRGINRNRKSLTIKLDNSGIMSERIIGEPQSASSTTRFRRLG